MQKLLLPLLLLSGLSGTAQDFHFSGGYNGSNVSEAGTEQWVGRAGYQFGVDVLVGHRWFLKPGVHFLVRNLNYSISNGTDVTAQEFQYTSRSLGVPLMLGLNLIDPSDDPSFNAYIIGGPTALISLNADLGTDELVVETNGTQWYLGFGGGLEFGFLFVEGGYNAAMSNVFKDEDFETNPKVNYLYGIVGLRLRLAN